jgi:hypothetical protein
VEYSKFLNVSHHMYPLSTMSSPMQEVKWKLVLTEHWVSVTVSLLQPAYPFPVVPVNGEFTVLNMVAKVKLSPVLN